MKRNLSIEPQTRQMRFDRDEDCRGIYRLLGDENQIADKFPLFYSAFQTAKMTPPEDAEPSGYINWLTLYSVTYDPESRQLEIHFNITLKQPGAQLFAYVYDADLTLFESVFFDDTQSADNITVFEDVKLEAGQSLNLYVECPFVAGNETILRGLRSSIKATYNDKEVIDIVEVNNPRLIKNISGPIKAVYGRKLGRGEVADYDYDESRTETGNQKFFMEVEGSAKLLPNYTVAKICSKQACAMTGGQFGTIRHRNATSQRVWTSSDKTTIYWKYGDDWNNEISDSVKFGQREYIFDLGITFKCTEIPNHTYRIHVTSYEKVIKPERGIPRIMLYWGCLAKDSLIYMADESKIPICSICLGDIVMTPQGTSRVTDIITGTEQSIYRLVMEGGLTIEASLMHPILTEQGFIPVRDVNGTTKVITREGSLKVLDCYPVAYENTVYGLELEGEAEAFFANGIAVGTNRVQGNMFSIPQHQETEQYSAFQRELNEMKRFVEDRGMTNGNSITHRY